ncbi:MAG: aconitase X swivel domain-containing protein [Thermoproteota archaeon]
MARCVKAKVIVKGKVEAESISSHQSINFFGGVDPNTGEVLEEGHAIKGMRIGGKILVFPCGKGSTVSSYVLYGLAKNGLGPAAIINTSFDAIIASGCIIANIPLLIAPGNFVNKVETGDRIRIDGSKGCIEVVRRGGSTSS